ncbi:MAG: adenosylmethionine--8-amino-7-oxononanoate transaminase, partial [Flavitalea sp.]
PIEKGDGAYLIDTNGKRYLDAISSWWVTVHGHAHPYIAQKLYEQALKIEQVIFAGFTHEPAVQLAERILPILPGNFSKIFYSDNGSTSTEVALKMSLQYWWNQGITKRKKILALRDSYHGDTFGAMSVSERSVFTMAFRDHLFEVIFIDNIEDVSGIAFPWDEIAAFIYEPLIQGAGGMKFYSKESLNEFLSTCKSHGVICIADEVMTGFGRTGKLFASEYCDSKPDIICLSKGLTGGTLPLGVTACTAEIHHAFVDDDKLKTFFHGHSFTANPLACSAALASLDLFENDNTLQRITQIGEWHSKYKNILLNSEINGSIKNFRQLGTIVAFEWEDSLSTYLNSISVGVTAKMLKLGIFLRPLGNTVYIMPIYCTTQEEIRTIYEKLFAVLKST